MNAVVGRNASMASAARPASKAPSTTTLPPRNKVPPAKRMGAEWCSGEHTRCRSPASKAHRSASSSNRARASVSLSTPDHTPLGVPEVPEV